MVTGSPGGRTIINTVMEIVLGVLDHGDDARQAVDALRARGHTIKFGGVQGDGHTIIVGDGVAYGANDHRSADSKVGVP